MATLPSGNPAPQSFRLPRRRHGLGPVCFSLWLLCAAVTLGHAANPVLRGYSDPAIRVWGGRMFLFVGKDRSPQDKGFVMPYWSIYSSADLVNWKLETNVDPANTFCGAGYTFCWSADAAQRNGKYYFYFSAHNQATGVLRAEAPNGPYVDVLKRPLVSEAWNYDPTVFADDDGKHYLIYGRDGQLGSKMIHYRIAPLNEDMVSLAGPPRDLITNQPYGFGTAHAARDHSYFHKYNGLYYLSCASVYMTAPNIYGPYSNPRRAGPGLGHSAFGGYNGQWYHAWEFTCDPYGVRTYRQVMLTYLHYKDNGDMVDDSFFVKGGGGYNCGVGNYDANWERIEAEWYFAMDGARKRQSPEGGFEIQGITNGAWLKFPRVKNMRANSRLSFRVASANPRGGRILIHRTDERGPLLGTCEVPSTGGWDSYAIVSCDLQNEAGTNDICLVFQGDLEPLRLNWLAFR
jgi:arabinoxylan arabinofuranohydrolase